MKTYVGIIRDHSGSMGGIARYAARDYNEVVASLKEAAHENSIDTIVSVIEVGGNTRRVVTNSAVGILQPIPETSYQASGGTPLYQGINEMLSLFEQVPDYKDPEVTFVLMVITDGAATDGGAQSLSLRIRRLIQTDRYTLTFRVPKGYGRDIARNLNVQEGNILEWDGRSSASLSQATVATRSAVKSMYAARASGVKSTQTFYADLSQVSAADVKVACTDISDKVVFYPIGMKYHDLEIQDVIWNITGKPFVRGEAFYKLTKTEKAVQDYKKIAIRDKKTGAVYAGAAARQMLNLPKYGDVRLVPASLGNYDVYIQSTSLNRKLKDGTDVMVYAGCQVEK